jgi:integrase
MAIHKLKRRGKVDWYFKFDLPGATRNSRRIIRGFGFATRQEAIAAEATRRIDENKKHEQAKAGAGVDAPVTKTLATLLDEFFHQHASENLAPKTTERYREQAAYLSPELLGKPFGEITPLHLNREWSRLLKSFSRAIKWGLATTNPVTNSEPPKVKKHHGIAFTPAVQKMVIEAATSPWCLRTYLERVAATGCRRGEMLALRWSDIVDGRAMIARSLTQTRELLQFKSTKSEEPRPVSPLVSAIAALEEHRKVQDEFRCQFGPEYRADLDLIFATLTGRHSSPTRLALRSRCCSGDSSCQRARACTRCGTRTARTCWPAACRRRRCPLA